MVNQEDDHFGESWAARSGRQLEVIAEHLLQPRSGSPIARQIIERDFAEYMSDAGDAGEEDDDFDEMSIAGSMAISRTRSMSIDHHRRRSSSIDMHAPHLYHNRPGGIAYGTVNRPAIAPVPTDITLISERELAEARHQEESLLRDNHFLPPKHGEPPPDESRWRKLYRKLFSTKIRDHQPTTKATETRPLLAGDFSDSDDAITAHDITWEEAVAADKIHTTWQREAKTLIVYSRSLVLTFLLHYSVQLVSVFTIGRFGKLELGAVSLAIMTANITCYAPVQGLATSLDTLCAQAYGSGQKRLVGLQVQRMTFCIWLMLLPLWVLWWNAELVLNLVIPEPDTAKMAGLYLKVLILGTPGVVAFETGKRFVMAQGLFHATTVVLLVGAPLNIVLNYVVVWKMGWGFVGAGITIACIQNLLPFFLYLYVVFIDGKECWGGLSKRAFENWGPMLKLAVPGLIMLEAQFLAFEILALVSAQFGSTTLAAQSVIVTITSTTFQLPFPLSIAASTRVANLIGASLVDAARTSAKVALAAGILVGLFNTTLLTTGRHVIPRLFTNDDEVAGLVTSMLPILGVLQIVDAIAAVSHGLLRGIGRQDIGGYTNLFAYYVIALPISFATAFGLGWELKGLWTGCTIGLFVVGAIELMYLRHADWDQAVKDAEHRNAHG